MTEYIHWDFSFFIHLVFTLLYIGLTPSRVYGHTQLDGQHISCRNSAGRCSIIHPIARTSRPVISIFSYTSRNSCSVSVRVFRMNREAELNVTVVPIPGGRVLGYRIQKLSQQLNTCCICSINLSSKLGFVSVNCQRGNLLCGRATHNTHNRNELRL